MSFSLTGEGESTKSVFSDNSLWSSMTPHDNQGSAGGNAGFMQQQISDAATQRYMDPVKNQQRNSAYQGQQMQQQQMMAARTDPHVLQGGPRMASGDAQGNAGRMLPVGAGGAGAPKMDMDKVHPGNFSKYILYWQRPFEYRKKDPATGQETGETEVKICKPSLVAFDLAAEIGLDVYPEEVRDLVRGGGIPPNELTRTPMLVNRASHKFYIGEACLRQLREILGTMPTGVLGTADGGISEDFGTAIDTGKIIEDMDKVPVSMASVARYFTKEKLKGDDAEEYMRRREQRSSQYQQNKPDPATAEAIKRGMALKYET